LTMGSVERASDPVCASGRVSVEGALGVTGRA
jgi:hypothetical protein